MRYAGILSAIALTELAAHFLSLTWGLMFLLAAFAWTALSGASTAAKARNTEDRVNALIPQVGTAYTLANNAFPKSGGTISGSVTVTGNHTVNGQVNTNTLGVSGTATTNAVTTNSVYCYGDTHTSGSHYVSGNMVASGQASGGSGSFGSVYSGPYEGSSIHVSGNAQADGSFSAGNFSGSYYGGQGGVSTVSGAPGSYSSSYETSLASAINGIISRLGSSGLI